MTDIEAILKELDELEEEGHTGAPVIARLRNHYRALADAIRAQRERIEKLEAVRKYARHSSGCEKSDNEEVCICGYARAWQALEAE